MFVIDLPQVMRDQHDLVRYAGGADPRALRGARAHPAAAPHAADHGGGQRVSIGRQGGARRQSRAVDGRSVGGVADRSKPGAYALCTRRHVPAERRSRWVRARSGRMDGRARRSPPRAGRTQRRGYGRGPRVGSLVAPPRSTRGGRQARCRGRASRGAPHAAPRALDAEASRGRTCRHGARRRGPQGARRRGASAASCGRRCTGHGTFMSTPSRSHSTSSCSSHR